MFLADEAMSTLGFTHLFLEFNAGISIKIIPLISVFSTDHARHHHTMNECLCLSGMAKDEDTMDGHGKFDPSV